MIGADEEIFEMNNGCICCTVRGDLIRILGTLMKRKDKFDYILVETTGLADPGPVAQTFFVDDEVKAKTRLDAIVTLVDALHFGRHADESPEVKEQIAFADVILLNKTDLVSPQELDELEARIRRMNAAAKIVRTRDAAVAMDAILDVRGFDLDRALEVDPAFLEPEYPFEWAGSYRLGAGAYELELAAGPDPSMDLVALRVGDGGELSPAELERAALQFSAPPQERRTGDSIAFAEQLWRIALDAARPVRVWVGADAPGTYAFFTQHGGAEYDVQLHDAAARRIVPLRATAFKPNHSHDASVTSVGIELPGDCVEDRLNAFFARLVAERGQDIFRMKGVLSIENGPRRFVFQGVHMLLDGRPDRPWGDEPRHNRLVFIGRNLNRESLVEEFRACLAS